MKALSVVSPWGDLIANGNKSLEIRSWHPDQLPMRDIVLVQNNTRLVTDSQEDPNGYAVAIIDIVGCRPWKKEDSQLACCDESEFISGYLAWEIENVRKLSKPFKVVAKRKFYKLSIAEIKLLKQLLET